MDFQLKSSRSTRRLVKHSWSDNIVNDFRELSLFIYDRLGRAGYIKTTEDFDKLAEVILGMVKIKYGKQIVKNSMIIKNTKSILDKFRRNVPFAFIRGVQQ